MAINSEIDLSSYPDATVAVIQAHKDYVTGVDIVPNGKALVSCSLDGTVKLWPLGGAMLGKAVLLAECHGGLFWVDVSSDGHRLASGGDTGFVHLWDWSDGEIPGERSEIGPIPDVVRSGCLGNSKRLAFARGTVLELRNLEKGSGQEPVTDVVTDRQVAKVSNAVTVAMSSDGVVVAAATTDGTLRAWSTEDEKLNSILRYEENSWVGVVAVSPNGKLVASCSDGYSIAIWRIAPLPAKKTIVLERGSDLLNAATFFPRGKLLASADKTGRIVVWDIEQQRKHCEFKLPDCVNCLAIAPDERHLVVGTVKGSVCVLRLRSK